MQEPPSPSSQAGQSKVRGRGRGKSRGGLGKYLRARGRGRGLGRPAEFGKRLLLEGEGEEGNDDDKEAAAEQAIKYHTRKLGTNADRYVEPEPELDSDGEEIQEPEVDLSSFLEKQRLSDLDAPSMLESDTLEDEQEIDHSLAHISSRPAPSAQTSRKGQVHSIEWDDELEQLCREKDAADAYRDLKSRLRAKQVGGVGRRGYQKDDVELHPFPGENVSSGKAPKEEMQGFLDGLLD